MRTRILLLCGLFPIALGALAARAGGASTPSRTFEFTYRTTIRDLPVNARDVDVWLPLPESDTAQSVGVLRLDAPGAVEIRHDLPFGNSALHVHLAHPGPAPVSVGLTAEVT